MLAFGTLAHAQDTVRSITKLDIATGDNAGRTNIQNGREKALDSAQAGNEHASLTALNGGRNILLFRTSSKATLNGEAVVDRVNLACAAVEVQAAGPALLVDKYITKNDGNQYRNAHATLASSVDGGKAALVTYNYRPENPNNTQRYAMVVDANCNVLAQQTLIMAKNNDDVCANAEPGALLAVESTPGLDRFVQGCGGNGNNKDDGWVVGFSVQKNAAGQFTIKKDYDVDIEPNEERTRMTGVLGPAGSNMVAMCASAGNTQPTNQGVRCYGVDVSAAGQQGAEAQSRLLWRQYLARREGEIYQTQIKLAADASTPGAATATWQTLVQRNRKGKGAATLNLTRLAFDRTGMKVLTPAIQGAFPGGDATHRTMIATKWGNDGAEKDAVMLISSSVNGSPNINAQGLMMTFDATASTFATGKRQDIGAALDNAWISNIYGNNPNNQGRNHIQGTEIPNPDYKVAGGFRPDVKSFVAIPATPRRLRNPNDPTQGLEDKLALELVLIPAVLAPAVVDPMEPPPAALDPNTGTPLTPTPSNTPGQDVGGCSVGSSSGFGSLALLGLALLGVLRRRRRY
jgi:MYXO-CTERM domain-containing protein